MNGPNRRSAEADIAQQARADAAPLPLRIAGIDEAGRGPLAGPW